MENIRNESLPESCFSYMKPEKCVESVESVDASKKANYDAKKEKEYREDSCGIVLSKVLEQS